MEGRAMGFAGLVAIAIAIAIGIENTTRYAFHR
jgi:hypothetical protein